MNNIAFQITLQNNALYLFSVTTYKSEKNWEEGTVKQAERGSAIVSFCGLR